MKIILKFLIVLTGSLSLAHSISAGIILEKEINFEVNPLILQKNNTQFAYLLGSGAELKKIFPDLKSLDRFNSLKNKKLRLFISKSAFLIKKPFGFFGHDLTQDHNFLKQLMGDQEIKKIGENKFLVNVQGDTAHEYSMDIFYDSDEISNTTNSFALKSINTIRNLDLIARGNASFFIKDLSQFSKYADSGRDIFIFSALNAEKSIVIIYHLLFIQKNYALTKPLVRNYLQEVETLKVLLEKFPLN